MSPKYDTGCHRVASVVTLALSASNEPRLNANRGRPAAGEMPPDGPPLEGPELRAGGSFLMDDEPKLDRRPRRDVEQVDPGDG